MKNRITYLSLATALAGLPSMAHAQDVPPAAASPAPATPAPATPAPATPAPATDVAAADSGGLDDIVVTAQRRAENLQKVPISVAALSGAELAAAGIEDLPGLRVAVPGLNFQSIQGLATPRLRGIGSSASGPGIEPEVAVYVDNVYYASAAASLFSFNNVAQVSVLKGPQGTLFGRNAVGGLVQITTLDPTQTFAMRGEIGYGNYQTLKGKFYVAGGLAPNLAMDFAAQGLTMGDGFGTNLLTGQDTRRTDHDVAFRSKLVFTPGEATTISLSGDFADSNGSQGSIRLEPGSRPNPATGPVYGGRVWDIVSDIESFVNTRAYGGSLKIAQDVGSLNLLSITALRYLDYGNALDLDTTARAFQAVEKFQKDRQFSQELQLQSGSSGPFTWTVGLYYFNLKSKYVPNNFRLFYNNNPSPPNAAFPLVRAATFSTQIAESVAGYGQATYEFLPDTRLTLGLRYTHEKRSLDGFIVQSFADGRPSRTLPPTVPIRPVSVNKPTYRASIDHQLTPDVLLYASFNRGFKSGGFNSGAINDPAYRPEILDAYEAGFKSQFLDRRISLNASAFYYDYTDIQTQRLNNGALGIINGASASVTGLDIDTAFAVTPEFQINAGVEFLDGEFGSFPAAPISTPLGGTPVTIGDVSGNRLPIASKFSSTVGANYTFDLSGGSRIVAASTLYYNSGWFTEPDNAIRQKRFAELSASLRWTSADERYFASVWGSNLTNAKSRGNATTLAFGNHVVSFNPPRTYGVTAGFSF